MRAIHRRAAVRSIPRPHRAAATITWLLLLAIAALAVVLYRTDPAPTWREVLLEDAGIAIQFPAEPARQTNGPITFVQTRTRAGQFLVSWVERFDLRDATPEAKVEFAQGAARAGVAAVKGTTNVSLAPRKLASGRPAAEARATLGRSTVFSVVLVDGTLVIPLAGQLSAGNERNATFFLDSLRFLAR